ncbi:serine hydroxymethyltransferase [Streptococcus sp. S784/96/1]|uniref:serine hydroxymethyltransferase n=1 Tax=Streptococcus sp. S784/96/1 TaxID=2653499 RepID=UPI001389A582|nr:serine hydroxymethyltransferase [Streptococcus sp. S784/96/1]
MLIDNQKELVLKGYSKLKEKYTEISDILDKEVLRQQKTLSLVASCCAVSPEVLAAMSSALVNVTAEGSPKFRYHAGCENVDLVEQIAINSACELFGASYANVQPHSASSANYEVISQLLSPGDTILGMDMDSGGHLTHGSSVTLSGTYYNSVGYHTTSEGEIDFEEVEKLALGNKPRLIICGATAYSREIDFKKFREIADKVDAILLADISHIAGLVIAGYHNSPINFAHVTTTCTHKQLAGPRGGLILSGKDADTLVPGKNITFRRALQKAVFPWMQGAPAVNLIAAKAVTFQKAKTKEFKEYISRIRETANFMAEEFNKCGFEVVGGKSENHTILLKLHGEMTGYIAEKALEKYSVIVNKNRIPGETRTSTVTSGLRIGVGALAQRNIDKEGCVEIVKLFCEILENVIPINDKEFSEKYDLTEIKDRVEEICNRYPIEEYLV